MAQQKNESPADWVGVMAVLQLPGLLAMVGGTWICWIVMGFGSPIVAVLMLGVVIWLVIEAFAAPWNGAQSDRRKRLAGNVRRLILGVILAGVVVFIVLSGGRSGDSAWLSQLLWLLGLVPTISAVVIDGLVAKSIGPKEPNHTPEPTSPSDGGSS
jgi:high-affinity Fe2+/Pb2+ permease